MQPLVSVVVPCYNAEKWIYECIESIIKQDYKNIEIIIVNDASTDNSTNIITNLWRHLMPISKNEILITLIENDQNLGECKTSAIGFNAANGKYICRLSADDMFVKSEHISIQVAEMEKYNLDWCYNNINLIGRSLKTARISKTAWLSPPIRYFANLFYIFDNILLKFHNICYLLIGIRNPINSSAMMMKATIFKNPLPWLSISWDNYLRSVCDGSLIAKMFLMKYKVRAIHSIGAFYRIHPQQATGKPETTKDLLEVKQQIYKEIINSSLPYPLWMKIAAQIMVRH